jgi:hypothetical protein
MEPVPSPFLTSLDFVSDRAADDRSDITDPKLFDTTHTRKELAELRTSFPGRSQFAVIDLDCCLLLSLQLCQSRLQGFDVTVLLFLLAHFDHKKPTIKISLTEMARQLDRHTSQVRRSMRRLEELGWARFDRRGSIELSPIIIRSANPKYRAIQFRHADNPFRRDT